MAFATVSDVVEYIKQDGIRFLGVRFTDVPGTEHHFTTPAEEFDEDAAEQGLALHGSSVRGFTSIDESDMTLLPDPGTATLDPFCIEKTLNMNFFVHAPLTREPYARDPRNVARKTEEYLASTGIAATCNLGAEAKFYLFDSVCYATETNAGFYEDDSNEGWWNRGKATNLDDTRNLGSKVRVKGSYSPPRLMNRRSISAMR